MTVSFSRACVVAAILRSIRATTSILPLKLPRALNQAAAAAAGKTKTSQFQPRENAEFSPLTRKHVFRFKRERESEKKSVHLIS